jgi:hypothetical protein
VCAITEPTCIRGLRSARKVLGSSKASGSRLAAPKDINTRDPDGIVIGAAGVGVNHPAEKVGGGFVTAIKSRMAM